MESNALNTDATKPAPKPTPPAKKLRVIAPRTPHLMQKPFQNRGLNDLKIRLQNR